MKKLAILTLPLLLAACNSDGNSGNGNGGNITVTPNKTTIALNPSSRDGQTSYTFTNAAGGPATVISSAVVSWVDPVTKAAQSSTVSLGKFTVPAGKVCPQGGSDCFGGDATFVEQSITKTISDNLLFSDILAKNPSVRDLPVTVAFNNVAPTTMYFTSQVVTPPGETPKPVENAPAPTLSLVGTGPYTKAMTVQVSGNFDAGSEVGKVVLEITDSKGFKDNSTYVSSNSQASFSVDTTRFANGIVKMQVVAYTKSGLQGTSTIESVTFANILNPVMSITAPGNGSTVNNPIIPVKVVIAKNGNTDFTFDPTTLQVELQDFRGVAIDKRNAANGNPLSCSPSVDKATYTCEGSFKMAELTADIYTIQATANVNVVGATPTNQTISATSSFTANTSSVLPPSALIRFPTAYTDAAGNRRPAVIDAQSGLFATLGDNVAIGSLIVTAVGPFDRNVIEPDGTRQCTSSSEVIGQGLNVTLATLKGSSASPYIQDNIFLTNLDIDSSGFVPNSAQGQRYDLRVVTSDIEGNRNIQCVPVIVDRNLQRPMYDRSYLQTIPKEPNLVSGQLNYNSADWQLGGITNNSRVVAALYKDGNIVDTAFIGGTGSDKSVTVNFGFAVPGNYTVRWLIQDMTTGVVTSVTGRSVAVVRNL